MIYFDNGATAAPLKQAVDSALYAMSEAFGNPSSLHAMGTKAAAILGESRQSLATALNCPPSSIIFTSGGTESASIAINSAAAKVKRQRNHIITSAIEHEATLNTLLNLKERGFDITILSPGRDGAVPLKDIESAITPQTLLICLQAVNNETGAIQPYEEAARMLKAGNPDAFFFLDGVQGLFKIPLNTDNIDFMSVSAHKIGGIKGAGALYAKNPKSVVPQLLGGGQESGLRSGTEAVPAIAAFGAACKARHQNMERDIAHMAALKSALIDGLSAHNIEYTLNTPLHSAPHIANIALKKGRSEVYIRALSDMGFAVSGGSACKRGKRSYVLAAMGLPTSLTDGVLRISFCPENTFDEVGAFLAALKECQKLFPR